MTDFHVITPEAEELVMQVIDGKLIIIPTMTTQQHLEFFGKDLPIASPSG